MQSPVELRNDNGMPQIGVYDYGKQAGRQLWEGMVHTLVGSGLVDGIFGDKWNVYATNNASNTTQPDPGGWKVCNHWCGGLSEKQALAFNAGKNASLQSVEKFLGARAVYFSASECEGLPSDLSQVLLEEASSWAGRCEDAHV
jgi:hypothetical protein